MGVNRNKTKTTNSSPPTKIETCIVRTTNICSECCKMESSSAMVYSSITTNRKKHYISYFNRKSTVQIDKRTHEFLKKCRIIHGPRYFYHKTIYKNRSSKIIITCLEHGDYTQNAGSHLSGSGCKSCYANQVSNRLIKSSSYWISKFNLVHGDKYTYTFVLNDTSTVNVHCTLHDSITTCLKSNVGRGHGPACCKKAFLRKKYQTPPSLFLTSAKKIHNDKYDYSLVQYTNTHTKVKIVCPIHNEFNQTPLNHLHGAGCPVCARITKAEFSVGGFTAKRFNAHPELQSLPAILYIIQCIDPIEPFIKIGITTKTVEERFSFKSVFPYPYKIIKTIPGKLYELFLTEQEVKKQLKSHKYKPQLKFDGYTECFSLCAQNDLLNLIGINTHHTNKD